MLFKGGEIMVKNYILSSSGVAGCAVQNENIQRLLQGQLAFTVKEQKRLAKFKTF